MVMQAGASKTTEDSPPAHQRWAEAVIPGRLRNKEERRRNWVEVAIPRGSGSEAERPWRAASLTMAGAITVLFFAYPRKLSLTTVQWLGLWGQLVSMVAIVLAIFMLVYPRSANVTGPFAIIAGILSFPILLGGVLVGSICLILGGALAFAWMPAPPEARAYASRAPHTYLLLPFRFLADVIDGTLFMLAAVAAGYTFLHGPMKDSPLLVYVVELALWSAIFIPGTARGVTPGKLLLRLRIWDTETMEPPGLQRAVVREAIRGAEVVGLIILLPLLFDVPQIVAIAMIVAVATAGVLGAHFGKFPHDLAAGTSISLLHVVLPEEGELEPGTPLEDVHHIVTEPAQLDLTSRVRAEPVKGVRTLSANAKTALADDEEQDHEIESLVESLDAVLAAATRDPAGGPERSRMSRNKKAPDKADRVSPTREGRPRKTPGK